jgi:NADH dehydrogenase
MAKIMKLFTKDPKLTWQTIAGIVQDANLDPGEAMAEIGYVPVNVSNKLPELFPRIL